MPDIQVLGREAVDVYNRQREDEMRRQELTADTMYKTHLINYNKKMAEVAAKNATTSAQEMEYKKRVERLTNIQNLQDEGWSYATGDGKYDVDPDKLQSFYAKGVAQLMRLDPEYANEYRALAESMPSQPSLAGRKTAADISKTMAEVGSTQAETMLLQEAARKIQERMGARPTAAAPSAPTMMSPMQRSQDAMQNLRSAGEAFDQGLTAPATPAPTTVAPSESQFDWTQPTLGSFTKGGLSINFPESDYGRAYASAVGGIEGKFGREPAPAETTRRWEDAANASTYTTNSVISALRNPEFKKYMAFGSGRVARGFARWSPEGQKYLAFQAMAKNTLNQYRKIITGAQASYAELEDFITAVVGTPGKDTYEVFMAKNLVLAYMAIGQLETSIRLNKQYDTTALQETLGQLYTNAEETRAQLTAEGLDLGSLIEGLPIGNADYKQAATIISAGREQGKNITFKGAMNAINRQKALRGGR